MCECLQRVGACPSFKERVKRPARKLRAVGGSCLSVWYVIPSGPGAEFLHVWRASEMSSMVMSSMMGSSVDRGAGAGSGL